ncbi:flagellar hook-basal body complex protein FliE [Polymorphobacter sp.]|uniref:flagellar hook-basal body complex protein FliE n=1 Tax=Polymorphobacter sp. TaxID=1909290 RepID=UPI003F70EC22
MLPPVDISSVMSMRARAQPAVPPSAEPTSVPFASAMSDALKAVSAVQNEAGAQSAAYERGDTQDLAQVMIARQKASLAFEATLQVRNRLLGAYKDVMSMPL